MLKPLSFGAVECRKFVQVGGPTAEQLGVKPHVIRDILSLKMQLDNPDSAHWLEGQDDIFVDGDDYKPLKPLRLPVAEERAAVDAVTDTFTPEYSAWRCEQLENNGVKPHVEPGSSLDKAIRARKKAFKDFNQKTGPFATALAAVVKQARDAGTMVNRVIQYEIDGSAVNLNDHAGQLERVSEALPRETNKEIQDVLALFRIKPNA